MVTFCFGLICHFDRAAEQQVDGIAECVVIDGSLVAIW